jgi:hypothetical protein
MNEKIAGMKNITVILGCDSGERGWESEELRRTAFAHAVIEGLGGKATPTRDQYVTGRDLFQFVRASVRDWTQRNRPTTQNPVLLPLGEVGEQRAFETTLMLHHATPDEPSKPADPMPGLLKRWDEYGKLANAKPGPEVYTPRRWRRYRELLLRYEYAARAGESKTMEAVEAELDKEARSVRAGQQAEFIRDTRTASVPMWQASGQAPAVGQTYDSELRSAGGAFFISGTDDALKRFMEEFNRRTADRVAFSNDILVTVLKASAGEPVLEPQSLARRARLLRAMWESQPVRPPDVQLFLMLDQFSRLQGDEPWPSETDANGKRLWQRAIHVRRLAEEAALGPVSDSHPYSESVWRVVQAVVQSGDQSRRRGEDLLFALEPDRKAAFAEFAAAQNQYERAIKRAVQIRLNLELRDRVFADLPHLGRWSVLEGEEKFNPKPRDLWKSVHKLAKLLDELPPESAEPGQPASQAKFAELNATADEVRTGFDKLNAEYARAFEAESRVVDVKLQSTWLAREKLLAVPPLRLKVDSIGIRGKIVEANRAATRYFLDPANKTAGRADDARERDAARKDRAISAGHLGLNELGRDRIDKQKQADDTLSSWDAVSEEIIKINEKSWQEAAAAGDRLLRHFAVAAKQLDPVGADPKAADAARFSRSIVVFETRDGREPAETNRDFCWQKLFTGQARRTVLDHWYDDGAAQPKYFFDLAKAFLADSDALTPPDPTKAADHAPGHDARTLLGMSEVQYAEFEKLRTADRLLLDAAPGGGPWTTEPQRPVVFKLKAAAVPPEGAAVVWAAFDPKEAKQRRIKFGPGSSERKALALKPGESTLTSILIPPDAAQSVRESVVVRRSGFFRGQVVKQDAPVDLLRMPDLIATHVRPLGVPPRVAFVGGNDIDVGVVSIVIDYSPSMTDKPGDEKSRLDRLWVELRTILRSLPDKTVLKVRGFGVAPDPGVVRTESLPFESASTAGVSNQTPDGFDPKDVDKETFPGTFDRRVLDDHIVRWGSEPKLLDDFIEKLKQVPWHMTGVGGNKRKGVNSPVVRSMINAVKQDFEKVPEHQRRVLIVLTDGADNSCYEYDAQGNGTRSDGRSLDALEQEFTHGKGQGVAAHVLLIKDERNTVDKKEKDEIEKFQRAAGGKLGLFKPAGQVHFEELEKLARTLADQLRPRVRLSRDGKELDRAIQFDAPNWERPEWNSLGDLGYETWVGRRSIEFPTQQLEFQAADSMLVRLSRPDPAKPVQFERVLWGRYGLFGQKLEAAKRTVESPDKSWLLSIPRYRSSIDGWHGENLQASGLHSLEITAAVEEQRSVKGQPLRQPAPAFAWWELSADAPLAVKNAPVLVWRESGNPAPSWRIRRYGWTDATNGDLLAKGTLRGWVEQRERAVLPRDTTTIEELATGTASGKNMDGSTWRDAWESPEWLVRFGWEMHEFATNPDVPDREKPQACLVVRIYSKNKDRLPQVNGKPAPFFVQVEGARIEEHRYFRGVGAYTGYFVVGATPDNALNRSVRLYSVADLVEPKAGAAFEFPLPASKADGSDGVWTDWFGKLAPQSKSPPQP